MRVWVDGAMCQGHNRCTSLAPELFVADDLGFAHEVNEGAVPAELEARARLAVASCPEGAIRLELEGE